MTNASDVASAPDAIHGAPEPRARLASSAATSPSNSLTMAAMLDTMQNEQAQGHPHCLSPLLSKATATSPMASPSSVAATASTVQPLISPTSISKLPGLHYAIAHQRAELTLPSLTSPNASAILKEGQPGAAMSSPRTLSLSLTHCETPQYHANVSACPEASPSEKKKNQGGSSSTPVASTALAMSHGRPLPTEAPVEAAMPASHESSSSKGSEKANAASALASASSGRKKGTRRGTLNAEAKNVLKAWMFSREHFAHPYPSEEEKEELAHEAGIEVKQLSNWFTNARKRLWQPVLRQSGVEVKNFLSTGRGGPRGNKLEMPLHLHQLVSQQKLLTPPQSPQPEAVEGKPLSRSTSSSSANSPKKRPRMDSENSRGTPMVASAASSSSSTALSNKKRKASQAGPSSGRKRSKDLGVSAASTRPSTNTSAARPGPLGALQELEILAATSLIGLHRQ